MVRRWFLPQSPVNVIAASLHMLGGGCLSLQPEHTPFFFFTKDALDTVVHAHFETVIFSIYVKRIICSISKI
jgi:hypothetical protein